MKKFKKQITKAKYERVWKDKRSEILVKFKHPNTFFDKDVYKMLTNKLTKAFVKGFGVSCDYFVKLDNFMYSVEVDMEGKRTYWREAVKPVECYQVDVGYGQDD